MNEVQVIEVSTKKISRKFFASSPPLIADLFKDGKKYLLAADGRVLKCVLLR
jgi:hypothetical protein